MNKAWVGFCTILLVLATALYARAQYGDVGGFGGPVSGTSSGGGGGGSGTVSPGSPPDAVEYTGTTTVGDTGVAWPPRLDQLGFPAEADYDAGGFFTVLHNGTYQQIGAPLVFGSPNEQLNGVTVPHFLTQTACASESVNAAGTTTATPGSGAGGAYLTLSQPLSSLPDIGTAIEDTTSGTIVQVCGSGNNSGLCTGTTGTSTTSQIYVSSTTGITTGDTVVTGMAMICDTPANTQPYEALLVGGALDQTTQTFTVPSNWTSAPFLPGAENGREVGVWIYPNTSGVGATYTFSWTTPANGSFIMARVGNVNLGTPFENTSGFISGSGTTAGLGGILNNATTDLFASFVTQATGATLTLPAAPTEGKGIIEDVFYAAGSTPPTGACDNVDQNAYGYTPPYNNVLFTDPQWGGEYQRMIRNGPGGNVDHNFYYSRNSWNANHTLMLGLQTPPSANGTGSPWVMALFDANGCFLKPLFDATGAQPTFNWRVNWSKTDPNVFYTGGSGTAGTWPGLGNLHVDHLYAMHPCAGATTGIPDAVCTGTQTMAVQDIFTFSNSLTTGSNFISTNEPTGPSLDEAGTRIGIVTRPSSNTTGDYYWSSLTLTNSTTVNPSTLHTYDITAGVPSGYCHSAGEVEKDRYTGQGDKFQVAVYRGSGTPACSVAAFDAGMQVVDDATDTQYSFIAQDVNAPWLNGGGHETWSPTISGAPGGGYFCYAHVDGGSQFGLTSCTASGNVATCSASGGYNFPKWPIGTIVQGKSISVSGYNVYGATTSAGGTGTISYQLSTTPGAATGGSLNDGNQWEEHCIGTNGTGDVTNFEGVDEQSAQTVHAFWPWGSTANGNTATDFYYTGYAYNGFSQYPTTPITTCTHSGTTVTCNIAALPSLWISPQQNNGLGSLGGSTVYVSGVSDGADQCYNGGFPITHTTSTSFQYTALCTPGANATGGTAYVGPTDEVYKCYVGDATYGNGCVPQLRTYTAQVTSDFEFQPLPNGDAEGDLVEFDSAPGVVPVNQYGKLNDAKTLLPSTTPPYNATAFYTYASISPQGVFDSTASGTWSGVTVALQGSPGVNVVPVYNPITGALSGQGNQFQNGAPPVAIGDAEVEGAPIGAVVTTPSINASYISLPGPYTQYTCNAGLANTITTDGNGNLYICNGSSWSQLGSGGGGGGTNPIYNTALTAGTTATLTVHSSSIPVIDTETFSPTGNATITTPAAASMANGEQILLETENSGHAYTNTFSAGTGVTLKTLVAGDLATTVGQVCAPPTTGQAWYRFQWDSNLDFLTLMDCGPQPSGPLLAIQGGTGVSSPTAHSILQAEGAGAFSLLTAATGGNIIVDQGAGSDWQSETMSGDCVLASPAAVITCTKSSGVAFGTAAFKNFGTSGGTVPLLNAANTWSGVQSFTNGDLSLLGGSSGNTLLEAATAAGSGTVATLPGNTGTIAELNLAQTWSAQQNLSGAGLTSGTVPTASLATVQGNGTKVQLSTGTTTTNDCVKFDANGNTVDNGSACGGGGGSGTINNASQYDAPYYSASGSANTISGAAIAGLQLDSTSGVPAAYGGATCTNQAITALNASGAATCNTISSSYMATTGVSAGSYTLSSITVNAEGLITAASNGSVPQFTTAMTAAVAMNSFGGL